MLHIVNKSPQQTTALASCLRLAKDGSALLLTEDAVYAATPALAAASGIAEAVKRLHVHVLQPDVAARGMAGKLIDGVRAVGYDGFVDLVAEHPTNQSWL
jgi:tRNA 2-thiouridine synthesizing protein B